MTGDSSHHKKLLLIDDEPDIVSVFKQGLENAGYEVDSFTEPRSALENFKPNYYDRIIIDVRMPGVSGFELARKIWAKDNDAQICFFSSFAVHEREARKVFSNLKSYCFIEKVITPSMLAQHIEGHAIKR